MNENIPYIPKQKITVPACGFVRRQRNHTGSSMLMIHGGAGMGKTVFLAQLQEQWGHCVYLPLGRDDNDEGYFAAHIKSVFTSQSGGEEIEADTAVIWIRTLAEEGGALLIDNADLIDAPASLALLESLIAPAAEGTYHAAVAGREVPGILLPYILSGVCREISYRELLFTETETAEHIRKRLPSDCAVLSQDSGLPLPDIAELLNSYTGGWPAAEAMILQEIAGGRDKELQLTSLVRRSHLGRFIESRILAGLEAERETYAKYTAFLGRCGEDLCRYVLHDSTGSEKLAYMISHGILVAADCGGEYPVYAPATRLVLSDMIPVEERKRLAGDAVRFYVTNGRIAEAVSLTEEYGDAEMAAGILTRFGGQLIAQARFDLIGCCADILDRYSMPVDAPVLGILAQLYYSRGQYAEMEQALNSADSMFGKENVYSVYRGLYNGLLKFDRNPELYTRNICRFASYLQEHGLPLPFLYSKETELLTSVLADGGEMKKATVQLHRFGTFTVSLPRGDIQWRTKKACEFLAYMIERDGSPIERNQIIEKLWPDNMPANTVAMLHNIIYSLRKELEPIRPTEMILYKNKCYALDLSLVEDCDSDIFAACEAVDNKDPEMLLRNADRFKTYWGKYLGNLDCVWAEELREHYDKRYVDGCLMLAAHFHREKAYGRELAYLKNASLCDPYSEQVIRELLYCHTAMGYPNKAMARYEEYCTLIGEELGIEPSTWLKKEYLACFSKDRGESI